MPTSRPANERDRVAWANARLLPPDPPKMVECPACRGRGFRRYDTGNWRCNTCGGAGEVTADRARDWSRANER